MGSKRAGGRQSLLMRYIRAPIWLLAQVRDLYVESLTGSRGQVVYGNAMGCPTPQYQISSSPGRFSVNSPTSNSKTAAAGKIGVEFRRSKTAMPLVGRGGAAASEPRSRSIGFERIDEDKPFEFGEGREKVGLLKQFMPSEKLERVKQRAVPILIC